MCTLLPAPFLWLLPSELADRGEVEEEGTESGTAGNGSTAKSSTNGGSSKAAGGIELGSMDGEESDGEGRWGDQEEGPSRRVRDPQREWFEGGGPGEHPKSG